MCDSANNWVVRLVRRDNDTRMYWYDRHSNVNSRLSNAMKMDKDTAVQFARAINDNSREYKARAYRYETSVAQKNAQLAALRKPDSLKSEEQVRIEELTSENANLRRRIEELEGALNEAVKG